MVLYRRLSDYGDEKKEVDVKTAQAMAANDLLGETDEPAAECPDAKPVSKVAKLRKKIITKITKIMRTPKYKSGESPTLIMQKKKGKKNMEVVQKPADINEDTEMVMAAPDARAGLF